jgi:hypothetical protein
MTAIMRLLPGTPRLGWYLGVVVLVVVIGECVLELFMFNIVHVLSYVEECRCKLNKTYFEIQMNL